MVCPESPYRSHRQRTAEQEWDRSCSCHLLGRQATSAVVRPAWGGSFFQRFLQISNLQCLERFFPLWVNINCLFQNQTRPLSTAFSISSDYKLGRELKEGTRTWKLEGRRVGICKAKRGPLPPTVYPILCV